MGIECDEMHELLTRAYEEAARKGNALVAHVGSAFFECERIEDLYRADGVRPTSEGTALASRVIAETLRNRGTDSPAVDSNSTVAAVEATFDAPDRATASALEYRIKRLSHAEKLALIESSRPES